MKTSTFAIVAVLVLVAGGVWSLSRSYYVGIDDQLVAIYQGTPASLGSLELSWVVGETTLHADDVPERQRALVEAGIPAVSPDDARAIVDSLRDQQD